MTPLAQKQFHPATLVRDFPPILTHPNPRLLYQIAAAEQSTSTTPITYSRYPELPFPEQPIIKTAFHAEPNFFTYTPDPAESTDPALIPWHLNFANYDVFAYYGRGLFAQDEMQVAEHPALASLRRALEPHHPATFCVHNGRPTPILIRNVERRVRIDTHPDPAKARPLGLYGNRFAQASTDAIRQATTKLDPPHSATSSPSKPPPAATAHTPSPKSNTSSPPPTPASVPPSSNPKPPTPTPASTSTPASGAAAPTAATAPS